MQSVEEFRKNFDKAYHNEIVPLLDFYEEKRIDSIIKCIIAVILGVFLLFLSYIIFLHIRNFVGELLYGSIGLVGLILTTVSVPAISKSFENEIKTETMPIILKNIPGFKWSDSEKIFYTEFIKNSKLIDDFNIARADDSFNGSYKNVQIDINDAEIALEGRNSYITKFKGITIKLLPKRQYKGLTLIKKRNLINNKPPQGQQKVNLEDVQFEKDYNVYSDDQIEARYVLTTAFMERFKNIKLAFKASKIEASISEQGILIAISTGRDLFKVGKLWRPVADYKQFKTMADEFASILELIDTLKLEQNIGL